MDNTVLEVEKYDCPKMEVVKLFSGSSLCQQVSPGHNEGTDDEEVDP